MARLLFPHPALDDEVYREVLRPLIGRASRDGGFAGRLRAGIATLDDKAGGDWLSASQARQIEVLELIEQGDFFRTMRNAIRGRLYRHPKAWKLIGYEGSSLEHGGYIERGFDEIDWLPEAGD